MALTGFPEVIEVTLGGVWTGKDGLSAGRVLTLRQVPGQPIWTESGADTPDAVSNRLRYVPVEYSATTGQVILSAATGGAWSQLGSAVGSLGGDGAYDFKDVWSGQSFFYGWAAGASGGWLSFGDVPYNSAIFSSISAGAAGVRATVNEAGGISAGSIAAGVMVGVTGTASGGTSDGEAQADVQIAAVLAEPGVTSIGYASQADHLGGSIVEAGTVSVGSAMLAAWARVILDEAGSVSQGAAAGQVVWPVRTVTLAEPGQTSAGSLLAAAKVSAALAASAATSAGAAAAKARIAAALTEPGSLSSAAAALAVSWRRRAILASEGVASRGRIRGVVGTIVGVEVPLGVSVEEKHGRVLSDESAELTYIIRRTHDDAVARQALLDASPSSWRGKSREDAEVEEIGHQLWLGSVRYSDKQTQRQTSQSRFSFETRGGSQHISQSLKTVARYAAAGLPGAPDFGGAIGVQDEQIQGTEITVPVYTFTETHYFDRVSTGYKSTLFYLTGRVNDARFKGLDAGEALFLGAAGSKPGDDPWEITFAFAGSPNVSGLLIGDITGIAKKGWEYLWVRYAEAEDAAAKMLIRRPVAAYVERVYREGNFGALGIGT